MTLLSDDIGRYAEQFTTPAPPYMAALTRETNMKTGRGEMLSGHLQGAFLEMFSYALQPSAILEIGTFTGYSACCLARGLKPGGKLHTIDIDEELHDMAYRYWQQAGVADLITQYTGEGADVIPGLDMTFDLVFIDADKLNYERYFDLVFDKVKPGGFILADNVLYDGEVVQPLAQQSKNARAMHQFNERITNDPRVENMLLPLRDGIMVIRKLIVNC